MRRVVPAPLLSVALFVLWLLLSQSLGAGTVLLGVVLALLAPALTAPLRPSPVHVRRPIVAVRLLARVVADSLRANVAVAAVIVRGRSARSGFVRVPLEVRDANALAVLAAIVAATPGTAWAELSFDRSVLLIHVLSIDDEAKIVAAIKRRYERPLMEIFE
jgi:multicomponent K+:H+ antiporter subunit E